MSDQVEVELVNVTKRYGTVVAADNINLKIGKGEFLSILGPTGCGKTTTLRLIGGFERPEQGQIILGGEDMADKGPSSRPTNTVFQEYALFPHMNAYENVAYGLRVKKMAKLELDKRVSEMFSMMRLVGKEKKHPHQLSGGERQRVALARALINRPRILLLDEPLSAIDQALRANMQEELRNLQQELGITFILVTHDQTEALTMSDRVAILRDGSLEQVDEGRAIYEHPASIFVAQFLGETNLIVGTVESIDNRLASVQTSYGKLVGVVSGDIHENAKVTLCVRPESLVIGDEAKHLTNRIVGKVIQKVFRGTTNKIIVALSTGEVMRLVNLSYSDVHVDLGDDCEIGWEPEHCTILQH